MQRPTTIASVLLAAAGSLFLMPSAPLSAQEPSRAVASGYDVNPGPLASIGPSLRDALPPADNQPLAALPEPAPAPDSKREPVYDLKTNSRLTPYLGLGGASANLDRVRPAASATTTTGEPVQGYKGVAGLAYAFDRNVQFNLGYRVSNFRRQDTPVPEDTEIERQSHDGRAMLLFKYELGGNK